MSQSTKIKKLTSNFFIPLASITILMWLLRGLGILTFIPSGLIWLMLVLAIATGILSRFQRRWTRF